MGREYLYGRIAGCPLGGARGAALVSAVNHSGDSDSTGALAGNILGARLGLKSLPRDWIGRLELTDVILKQAQNAVRAALDSPHPL